jgi:hypothetical protein
MWITKRVPEWLKMNNSINKKIIQLFFVGLFFALSNKDKGPRRAQPDGNAVNGRGVRWKTGVVAQDTPPSPPHGGTGALPFPEAPALPQPPGGGPERWGLPGCPAVSLIILERKAHLCYFFANLFI